MNPLAESATTIAVAIVGVALLAVFVSKNSNTANIIQNIGSAFGSSLATATGPVTGDTTAPNYAYAGQSTAFGGSRGFSPSSFA